MTTRKIWCCGCNKRVSARLTDGKEIYRHRVDLKELPFWKCDNCRNYVGCHHKTDNPTRPLGHIPTPQIRSLRKLIHSISDPLWKNGIISRKQFYVRMSKKLGWEYHTARIKSEEEALKIVEIIKKFRDTGELE